MPGLVEDGAVGESAGVRFVGMQPWRPAYPEVECLRTSIGPVDLHNDWDLAALSLEGDVLTLRFERGDSEESQVVCLSFHEARLTRVDLTGDEDFSLFHHVDYRVEGLSRPEFSLELGAGSVQLTASEVRLDVLTQRSDFLQRLVDDLRAARDLAVVSSVEDGYVSVTDPRGRGCPVQAYVVDSSVNGTVGEVRFEYSGVMSDLETFVRQVVRDATGGVDEVVWTRKGQVVRAAARFADGGRMTWRSSVLPGGARSERHYPAYGSLM